MSFPNSRFTLLTFPQHIDATGKLRINVVFLPRNINPLEKVNTIYNPSGAKAFALVQPEFIIKVVNNPNEFPGKLTGAPHEEARPLTGNIVYSTQAGQIYRTLKDATMINSSGQTVPKYFDIDENRSIDKLAPTEKEHRANAPVAKQKALRKYLPLSYRNSFNFTAPRTPNAVIDDSYHCAVRDQKKDPDFKESDGKVSWGKVYAHLMRQPHVAKQAGLIYELEVQLNPRDLEKGGWIYCDILNGDYSTEQAASGLPALPPNVNDPFIKKYACRIPPLKTGEARALFAAILFPVQKEGADPETTYDELYIEAARYSEGFAGLVHCFQARSQHLLKEETDGFHPQKEMGIRLGWDDEQILIWYLRQMSVDEHIPGGKRLDAPMGISGYNIDVRIPGTVQWESLNQVTGNSDLTLENINMGSFSGELPYQVYPAKMGESYWLPMFFASWNDRSMVLPDKRAAEIFANERDERVSVNLSDSYSPPEYTTKLKYGNQYEFRIRMYDLSGGGPASDVDPQTNVQGNTAITDFKRYVAPGALLLRHSDAELKPNTDGENFQVNQLHIQRPVLGYPAVLYTGKYDEADALTRLRNNREDNFARQATKQPIDGFGIPDMDVVKVRIKVEVETLKMDNLLSDTGMEHFITLYTTYHNFNAADPDDMLSIPIDWIDQKQLNLGDTHKPFDNDSDNTNKDGFALVLPRGRNIRLTLRACGEGDSTYWGNCDDTNPELDSRSGKTTVLSLRRETESEEQLLAVPDDATIIQALYLQPDLHKVKLNPSLTYALDGNSHLNSLPDIVQRLSKQINVESKELTLTAPLGERIVFWCSNLIRHNLAPDSSSITFSGTNELSGHWLVCTTLLIKRDWSWDSLDALAFTIERKRKQGRDNESFNDKEWKTVGTMDIQRVTGYQAIQKGKDGHVNRKYTRLVFIDVVDGKPPAGSYPDTTEVMYRITPNLKAGLNPLIDPPFEIQPLKLPAVYNPVQTPKLIGAGIALSPYIRNTKYSSTEPRKRYLWLEFDKKPDDGNDDIFARVLAYAPDQLLSNNDPALLAISEESPLPIDPEYIRVITHASAREDTGLNAMQPLEKSLDKNRNFYLLPLPPGLHHESPELFGFFTYEFRYGHSDRIWSTAQARYGRALYVAGLQHPAPNMIPVVNRDKKGIVVIAPYARTVSGGKNVTSNPPRSSIWCLLYAQVKQADGLDYRNILLDEIRLERKQPSRHRKIFSQRIQDAGDNKQLVHQLQQEMIQTIALEEEAIWQAYGTWTNKDVSEMLYLYGLPGDSALSVICVEVFGQITNIEQHINDFSDKKDELFASIARNYDQEFAGDMRTETYKSIHNGITTVKDSDPLKSELGYHRILRTSPLTKVPFICCPDCD